MKKILFALLILSGMQYNAAAQPYVLDPSFGNSALAGAAIFSGVMHGGGNYGQALLIQSDNKLLVTSGSDGGIARLNADGSLDNSFGNGWVTPGPYSLSSLLVQSDGKILASAGPTYISYNDGYVWRFNTNGTIDSTFGIYGRIADSTMGAFFMINQQGSSKFIISAYQGFKRVNMADGSIDASFGTAGYVHALTQLPLYPRTTVVDASGNILVGGYTYTNAHLAILRLTPDGQIDASFGTNGVDSLSALSTTLSPVMKIGLQSTGNIIMVADYDASGPGTGVEVVRFTANGAVDNSFGTNGVTSLSWYASSGYVSTGAMTIAGNDTILAAATFSDNNTPANLNDIGVQKLSPDGVINTSFGLLKLDVNHTNDEVQAIACTADGDIIINGGSSMDSDVVAKFEPGSELGINKIVAAFSNATLYPNPATDLTTLSFTLQKQCTVAANIYAIDGRKVKNIINNEPMAAGQYKKEIPTNDLVAGSYNVVISSDGGARQSLPFVVVGK